MFKHLYKVSLFIFSITLIISLCADAEQVKPGEYEVKAAFIYNFAKFIEWPDDSFLDKSSSITMCVIGDDPFGRSIDSIHDKPVKEKKLKVKHIQSVKDIKGCHILFISGSEAKNLPQILKITEGAGILTIGDTGGFAYSGVIINFYLEQNKVNFEINTKAAKRARLQISSKLLKLARIVGE